MPTAKDLILDRVKYLNKSFNEQTLNDKPTAFIDHNNIAKLLRNGMAVVGFVSLEDFIKKRTGEAMSQIGSFTVPFNDLPQAIKYKSTFELLSSLNRLSKFEPTKNDKIQFIQQQALKIASTSSTAFDISEFSFGYKASNIDQSEIKNILKSFYINDPWEQMSRISSRLGLTSFPLGNSFQNAANRRHNAAHEAYANIPINDVIQFIPEVLGITISFDSLISKALKFIERHDSIFLQGNKIISHDNINLSSVRLEQNKWKYKRENVIRSIKIDVDKDSLLRNVIPRAQINGETIIIYDAENEIENYYCF